ARSLVVAAMRGIAVDRDEARVVVGLEEVAVGGSKTAGRDVDSGSVFEIVGGLLPAALEDAQKGPPRSPAKVGKANHPGVACEQRSIGAFQKDLAHHAPSCIAWVAASLVELDHRQDQIGVELAREVPFVLER